MVALVRRIRFFRLRFESSSRTDGYGGWSWWQKSPCTSTPGKVDFPQSYRLQSARHPNDLSMWRAWVTD